MKSHRLLTVVVVVSLLVPGVAMAAVLGSPDLSAHLPDNEVTPGEQTSLGVVIQNSGSVESGSAVSPQLNSEVTTARGLTVSLGSGNAPITVHTGQRAVGSLPQGVSPPLAYSITVDEDAEPGTYRIPVHVSYEWTSYISEADGTRDENSTEETFYVPLEVRDEAQFEVTNVTADARVGESGSLQVTVRNTGTEDARNVDLTLTSSSAVTTFGTTTTATRFVADWNAGETRVLNYTLRTAASGEIAPYAFTLSAEYRDADGQPRVSETDGFAVTPMAEQEFSMTDVEATLRAGDEGTINATIVNEANTTVNGVVVEWASQSNTITPGETEYAVGDLGPGERATVSFDVEITEGAESGPRQFTFVTDYRDAEGDPHRSEELDVQATVQPARDEFDVSVVNGTVTAGESGQLQVELTNVGDEPLTDISAKLFADSPISTTDDEAFVESLGPGETETLTFSVSAGSGALEKPYPVSMDFQYEEPDGDTPISDSYRLPVQVVQPEESGGGSILPLAVGALLVVAVIAGAVRYFGLLE